MPSDKTTWSLVSLGATLAAAAIAFIVWHELWPAVILGAITGGFVAALRAPLDGQVSWTAGLVWAVATGLAAVCGLLAYTAWASLWLAIVLALVVAGGLGAVLSVLMWMVNPTPVDLDAILGEPDDIWWRLRDTAVWRRLSDWVEHRTATHSRSSAPSGG